MIDHVLGRPSVTFRKTQVFAVVSFWSLYLLRGNKDGPPIVRQLSSRLSKRLTAWQVLVITMLWLYVSRNFGKLVGLECPEPLANLYSRSYFRATWVTTALDAGFWSAMKIRNRRLREFASIVCTIYYLIAAEQADEKVRKIRGALTVDHLRVSWNKGTTPYLAFLTKLMRPPLSNYAPKKIRIPRPPESSYTEPVTGWLYYDAPFDTIAQHTSIVLDIPGGGFVAMDPRTNDDKLLAWSAKTGVPVLSLDYRKAPEYPYPYALNECFDVYGTLVESAGRCIGLSGLSPPRIVLAGDSAGGSLATGTVMMILEAGERLPPPDGLILIYPGLDMNIGSWMTDEQMSLIQDRRTRGRNRNILRRKSMEYYKLDPSTPHPSDDEDASGELDVEAVDRAMRNGGWGKQREESGKGKSKGKGKDASTSVPVSEQQSSIVQSKPAVMKTRLAMGSMISYFNDRILTPEMMRAMIILYIGPHNRPDFTSDYLLSPLLAPEALLAKFPKTYILTGERDPLVDDTVIFAGRLRQAKYNDYTGRKELGLLGHREQRRGFDEKEHVEVCLVPGISHGFFQFVGAFPEGWKYIFRCAGWMEEIFALDQPLEPVTPGFEGGMNGKVKHERHHRRKSTTGSSGDDDRPLEMTRMDGGRGAGGAGKAKGGKRRGTGGMGARQRSMVSLASEDDLLGRRMHGLAGGLMGMTPGDGGAVGE